MRLAPRSFTLAPLTLISAHIMTEHPGQRLHISACVALLAWRGIEIGTIGTKIASKGA